MGPLSMSDQPAGRWLRNTVFLEHPVSEPTSPRPHLSWMQSLVVFVGGGGLISLGDRSHIEFGVLVQDDTSFLGQAWWVVPLFGVVSWMLFYGYRALRIRMGDPAAGWNPTRAMLNAVVFLLAYGSTGPFAGYGWSLALVLGGLWVVRVFLHRESRSTILFALLVAVLGPIGESAISMLGVFHYTSPDLGLVHSWLPAVYLHGALVVPWVESLLLPATDAAPPTLAEP